MNHRTVINAKFDEAQDSLMEAGLSETASRALNIIRELFTEYVYTNVPNISIFANRKQIRVTCASSPDFDLEYDGSFEATIEDSGNIFVIAKKLNGDGSSETRQWMFSWSDITAYLDSHYWLEFVKLPEPIDTKLVGDEMEWDFIYPTIELNKYDGHLDFYGINLTTDQRIYIRLCHTEEMDGTRYYDVYSVPVPYYYLARIKHGIMGALFKIMPSVYSAINLRYIKSHNDAWYERNNSFPYRWFKKIAWTKF